MRVRDLIERLRIIAEDAEIDIVLGELVVLRHGGTWIRIEIDPPKRDTPPPSKGICGGGVQA